MAEMERVIHDGFIAAIENNRAALNAAFEYCNSSESRIDSADILIRFAEILNPLYNAGIAVSDKVLISVFKTLLKLIAKRLIGEKGRYRDIERNFYTIIETHKKLVSLHGGVFLINVYNALLNLQEKKIYHASRWVSGICSLPDSIDMDAFRKSGFLLAWICGAASAHESIPGIIRSLDRETIGKIFKTEISGPEIQKNLADLIETDSWSSPLSAIDKKHDSLPVFKTAGGFSGYGFEFSALPAASSIEGSLFVTDRINVFRVYADFYGVELVRDNSIHPDRIETGGVVNRFIKDGSFYFKQNQYSLPAGWKTGVTSLAVSRNTVIWTLKDSYKLYIAGIKNA